MQKILVLNNFMDPEGLNILSPNPDKLSKIMSPLKVGGEDKNENLNPSRISYNFNTNSLLSSTLSKNFSLNGELTGQKEDFQQNTGQSGARRN